MKILTEKYPLGSLRYQKTAGRYIDGAYYENLKTLAEVVTNDMTFMAIVSSSTLEVGTGKSTFVQQSAEAWVSLVNEIHKFNLPDLSMKNIVFKPKDLITRAFEVPQYSCVIVDEWDDAHYWSELGVSLRQFFRKCRQLNLFIIIIIPNFFQLPINYAISRSIFFVDVKFEGKFERGYFRFFSFKKKKELYLFGRKNQDYECVRPDFEGKFVDGYVVDEKTYRAAKRKDMVDAEAEIKIATPKQIEVRIFKRIRQNLPDLSMEKLTKAFGIGLRTGFMWMTYDKDFEEIPGNDVDASAQEYNKLPIKSMINPEEEGEAPQDIADG